MEDLSDYLAPGITLYLFKAIIIKVIIAFKSSYPGTVDGPQNMIAAILAVMANMIATTLSATASDQEIFYSNKVILLYFTLYEKL